MMRPASSSSLDDDKSKEIKEDERNESMGAAKKATSTSEPNTANDNLKVATESLMRVGIGSAASSASPAKTGATQESYKSETEPVKAKASSARDGVEDTRVEAAASVVASPDAQVATANSEMTGTNREKPSVDTAEAKAETEPKKAPEKKVAKAETTVDKAEASEENAQISEPNANQGEAKIEAEAKMKTSEAEAEQETSTSASVVVKTEAVDANAEVDAVAAEEEQDDSGGDKSSSASVSGTAAAAAKENKAENENSEEGKKGTPEAGGKIMLPPGGSFPRGSFLLDGVVLKRRRGRPSREPKADDFVALAVLTEEEQRQLLEPQKHAAAAAGEPVVLTPPPQGTTTTTTLSYAKTGEGETEDENIKIMGYHRFRGKQKPTQIWGVYGELMRKKQGAPRKVPLVTDFIPLDDTERQEALAAGFPMPDKPTQPPPPPPPPKQTTPQPASDADRDVIEQVSEFRFPGRQHATKIFRVNGELRKRKAGKPRLVAQASDFVPLTMDELHQVEGKPWNRGRPKRPVDEDDKNDDKNSDKQNAKEGEDANKESRKKQKTEQDSNDGGDSSATEKAGSPQESKTPLASGDVEVLGSVKFKGRQYVTPLFRVAGQIRKRKPGKPRLVPQVQDFLPLDDDEMDQVEASGILLRGGQPLPEVSRKRKEAESAAVGGLALGRVAEAARKLAEDEKKKKEKKRLSSSPSAALGAAATTAVAKDGGGENEDYNEDSPVVPWKQHRFRGKPYPTQLFRVQGKIMKRKPGKPRLVPQVGDFVPLDKDELHQVMQRGDVAGAAPSQEEETSASAEKDEGAKRPRLDRSRATGRTTPTAEKDNGEEKGEEKMDESTESQNEKSSRAEHDDDDKVTGDKNTTATASQGEAVMAG